MSRRDQIVEAIRAGANTVAKIADRLEIANFVVSHALIELRRQRRIVSTGAAPLTGRSGTPGLSYAAVEGWTPKPLNITVEDRASRSARLRARLADPEAESRRVAALRAACASGRVAVPDWVKSQPHRRIYRAIARVLDEEAAAEWARKAKALAA